MLDGGDQIDRVVTGIADFPRLRADVRRLASATSVSADDAVLATSELVTNALIHASGTCRLRCRNPPPGGPLRVEVADDDQATIVPSATVLADAVGGRGLLIVARITTRWGVQSHDGLGKTVWFEIDPTPSGDHVASHHEMHAVVAARHSATDPATTEP